MASLTSLPWRWFMAGFLAIFIGMALLVRMHVMHPSGEFVVECNLFQYYSFSVPNALRRPRFLGSSNVQFSTIALIAFQHILCSAAGGAAALGAGLGIQRLRARK